eukprot:9175836-Pyramimonas_sp.AAC.1
MQSGRGRKKPSHEAALRIRARGGIPFITTPFSESLQWRSTCARERIPSGPRRDSQSKSNNNLTYLAERTSVNY